MSFHTNRWIQKVQSVVSLPRPVFLSRLLFAGVVLCMLIIASVSLIHAILWIDRPFGGFLFYEFPGVGSFGDYNWPGVVSGVHYRDIILTVNGQPVSTGHEIDAIIGRAKVGDIVHYLLERDGQRLSISVPVSVFTLADFLKVFLVPFSNGFIFWLIGIIVFVLKPDTEVSWIHLLFCLLVGLYLLTGFELQSTSYPPWSYYLNMGALAFFPAAAIHLALIFPERTAWARKSPLVRALPYGLAAALYVVHVLAFLAVTQSPAGSARGPSFSHVMLETVKVNRVYGVLSAVAILASNGYAIWRSSSIIARQRARLILLSSGVAFIPPTFMQGIVSVTKIVIPFNLTAITLVAFPAAIGYAIARHNLFDVDVYIKRTVGYGIMTGVVAITYFTVQTVVSKFVLQPAFGAQAESIYPIIFALLIVFFFNPINRRVQEGVEKLFFRKPYDYKATVASIGDALTSLVNLDAILTKVISIIRTQLFLDRVGVVVLDPGQQACRFVFFGDPVESISQPAGHHVPRNDDPLLSVLGQEKRLITKYDIAEDPRFAPVRESCSRSFQDLGASLAVPLLYQDTFAGMLAVGYKKSGHFYSRDDIDLLKTASNMTATAIEQAREKEQRGTLMQLFSKHVSPEVAEELWRQRDQFLDGGRPRSQKQIVTVMFTDLQGFTSVSERFDPQVLMDWLNTYMDAIARTVMEHGGVVDDYFGDGVKVNFGVPVPRTTDAELRQDAVHAVTCAVALEQEIRRRNSLSQERGLPPLRMRIGINTGPVVAGSLGSADRMKYTTLGDTVNTAARLESFSKELDLSHLTESPCRILIGESTRRLLDDRFVTQSVGELSLKGKEERVRVHCVLGSSKRSPEEAAIASTRPAP